MSPDTVVVTGFGPFGSFTHNPSSDVVDKLEKEGIPGFDGKLVTKKISVTYKEVEEVVSGLWKEHSPKLVVHIGAHPEVRMIKLEQQSFALGYCRYDVEGCVPRNNTVPIVNEEVKLSSIPCKEIAEKVQRLIGNDHVKVVESDDPGRYLCAFSYYISLCHDSSRSLFIHVPAFDDECTVDLVTKAVSLCLSEIISTL